MDSRQIILDRIKQHTKQREPKPEMNFTPITYPDKVARFIEISRAVGGDAIELQPGQDINEVIRAAYTDAKPLRSAHAKNHIGDDKPGSRRGAG